MSPLLALHISISMSILVWAFYGHYVVVHTWTSAFNFETYSWTASES